MTSTTPPTALVTGVGRSIGVGAAIVTTLRADGWNVATCGWRGYDERMPWGADREPLAEFEADFSDAAAPQPLMDSVVAAYGPVTALVMCHCESVDSNILDTTVESWDRHFAVNARSIWLLIKAFAEQFPATASTEPATGPTGEGRIIAITSDHTAFNLPYGASKGALDRIVLASAVELAHLGLTANVINPGATDTGWMSAEITAAVLKGNLQPRVGTAQDCANLVSFLCSPAGQWINRQLLYSDGGR